MCYYEILETRFVQSLLQEQVKVPKHYEALLKLNILRLYRYFVTKLIITYYLNMYF